MPAAPAGPLVRLAELEIDPAHMDAYRHLLAEVIETSVATEPGVLALQAVALREDPAAVRVFEIYRDRQAYEAHLLTPHFTRYKTLTARMVRSLRLVETDPMILRGTLPG